MLIIVSAITLGDADAQSQDVNGPVYTLSVRLKVLSRDIEGVV